MKSIGIVPGEKIKEVNGNDKITSKTIREALPGQEIKNVIVSDGNKRLVHTMKFTGCLDEILVNHFYHIEQDIFMVGTSFTNFDEARLAWDQFPLV